MSANFSSPTSQGSELQSEEDDLLQAQKSVKKLTSQEVKGFRDASLETIKKNDVIVEGAVNAFFENRTADCQKLLNDNRMSDPLVITGSGLIAFLRYLLSMEQEQADVALKDINEGSAFSGQLLKPGKGMFAKMGLAFSSKKEGPESNWLQPGEFRAKTVHTESQALRALVLVLQANVMSFMKAGLALRRAYNGYTSLHKECEERKAAARAKLSPEELKAAEGKEIDIGLDRNSIYSVDFGLGAINIAISILPDAIMKMIKILGFVGDRQAGVVMEHRCLDSQTLLSPFASALLLAMYGALPLECTILRESYLPHVKILTEKTSANPTIKNSLLHLWLIARAQLITRDLDKSSELMLRCVKISEEEQIKVGMPQLRNFVFYDLMGTYLIQHEWEKAREAFDLLVKESKWSDIFYCYGQACCYEMMAFECELEGGSAQEVRRLKELASQQYWLTVHKKGTKMGGKIRAPDQIFGKRLEEMLELRGIPHPNKDYKDEVELTPLPEGTLLENTVPLPAYEMICIFNLTPRIPRGIMRAMVANIDHVLLKERLVKSQKNLQEADDERKLAAQEEGRANIEGKHYQAVAAEDDDEEDDEENFGEDDMDDENLYEAAASDAASASEGSPSAKTPSSRSGAAAKHKKHTAAAARNKTEKVLLPLQVAALNQANDKFRESKASKPANGVLACNYLITALSGMKALLLANSDEPEDRAEALQLIDAMLAAPSYKDKDWSLSYVQPNMLYQKACIVYHDGDGNANCDKRVACEELLRRYDHTYPDTHYYTHSMTEYRVHLAKCEFRNTKKEAQAEARAAKHADPSSS